MDVAGSRKAVVIHVPYRLRKAFRKIHVRQGDPLSPLFFNLVADIFTRMLIKAASNNLISSLSEENDSLSKTLYDPCYYVELYDPCYYVELLTEVFCAQMKYLTTTRLDTYSHGAFSSVSCIPCLVSHNSLSHLLVCITSINCCSFY